MVSIWDNLSNSFFGSLIIIIFSIIFALLVLMFYYKIDNIDPEPLENILIVYMLGAILPFLSIFIDLLLKFEFQRSLDFKITIFLDSVLIAPILEECIKGVLIIYLGNRLNFDSPLDGMIYGVAVGSGFSMTENIFFGLSTFYDRGLTSAIQLTFIRGAIAFIAHPLYSGLVGFGVGAYRVDIYSNPAMMFIVAIFFHMLWNLSFLLNLMYFSSSPNFVFIGMLIGSTIIVIIVTSSYFYMKLRLSIDIEKQLFEKGYFENKKSYKVFLT